MKKKRRAPPPSAPKPSAAPAFRPFAGLADKVAPARPAPAAPRPRPGPSAPEPDAELARRYTSGAVPLDAKRGMRVPRTASSLERRAPPPPPDPGFDPDAEARARLHALVVGTSRFDVTDDGARIEGRRASCDPTVVRRLRRGEMVVEATLDLHGHSAGEARRALEAFVAARRAERARVLLVIHGKGEHSPGGRGVLRGEIGAWLSEGPAARHVRCFTTAREHDGGQGALYVMLEG
jgi:DNA-nicking Smr family endonuclease